MRPVVRLLARVACGLAVLGVLGCSPAEPERPKLFPVSGTLFVDGVPAADALVRFHRADADWKAQASFAEVEADGGYKLTTFNKHDGAPEGTYHVTVVWAPRVNGDRGVDKLQGRYADAKSAIQTFTVTAGDNVVPPIKLKTK